MSLLLSIRHEKKPKTGIVLTLLYLSILHSVFSSLVGVLALAATTDLLPVMVFSIAVSLLAPLIVFWWCACHRAGTILVVLSMISAVLRLIFNDIFILMATVHTLVKRGWLSQLEWWALLGPILTISWLVTAEKLRKSNKNLQIKKRDARA